MTVFAAVECLHNRRVLAYRFGGSSSNSDVRAVGFQVLTDDEFVVVTHPFELDEKAFGHSLGADFFDIRHTIPTLVHDDHLFATGLDHGRRADLSACAARRRKSEV